MILRRSEAKENQATLRSSAPAIQLSDLAHLSVPKERGLSRDHGRFDDTSRWDKPMPEDLKKSL